MSPVEVFTVAIPLVGEIISVIELLSRLREIIPAVSFAVVFKMTFVFLRV